MDSSPKGREIERLEGKPHKIIKRGNAITTLGEQMISSASLLKDIADGASGQKGLAVDKLKDVVGDCHEELKLAGERYKPTGPVLVTYGNVVDEVQPLIKTAVKNCEADWTTYEMRRGDVVEALTAFYAAPIGDADPDKTPEERRQEAVSAAQSSADTAHENWEDEAKVFDRHYDTWEEAFNKAAAEIGTANSGGIEDSTWDDLDGFVAGALEVLRWVGLALAILGVIIGGPFIAALAAIAAIATLLLTIYAFARGNATGLDLVLAVVGVIPFGSLGKLFNGNKLQFADDVFGGFLSGSGRAAITGEVGGIVHGLTTGFTRGGGGLSGIMRGLNGARLSWVMPNGAGAGNIISRLFTGQNMNHFNQGGLSGVSILGGVWGDGFVKNVFGIPDTIFDWHNTMFSNP